MSYLTCLVHNVLLSGITVQIDRICLCILSGSKQEEYEASTPASQALVLVAEEP